VYLSHAIFRDSNPEAIAGGSPPNLTEPQNGCNVRIGDNPTVICDLPGTFPWIRIPPELKLLRRADYFNDFDERMMA
jgi:hypothetical protein